MRRIFKAWTALLKGNRPLNVQSLNVAVSAGNPKYGCNQVGRIELDTNYLQDLSLRGDNSMYDLIIWIDKIPNVIFVCERVLQRSGSHKKQHYPFHIISLHLHTSG